MSNLLILLIKEFLFFLLIFFGFYIYQLIFWLVDFKLIKLFKPSSSSLIDANNIHIAFTEYMYSRHKPSGMIGKLFPFIDLLGWGIFSIAIAYFLKTYIILAVALFFISLLFFINLGHPTIDNKEVLGIIKQNK
jgi:hypothetical protein